MYPGEETRNNMQRAVAHFDEAIAAEPNEPSHYAHAAEWRIALWCYGFCTRDESFDPARTTVDRGLAVAPTAPELLTMDAVLKMGDWEWGEAGEQFRAASTSKDTPPLAHHWHGLYLSARGQHQEAIASAERAVAIDPSVGNRTGLGATLYFARAFTRLEEVMKEVIKDAPEFAEGHDWLGMALVQLCRFDEAIQTYETAYRLSGGLAEINAGRGHAYGMAGDRKRAREVADQLREQSETWHIPPVQRAFVAISLEEFDEAFELLQVAIRQKSWELAFVDTEPWLDEIRGDDRFRPVRAAVWSPKMP